MEIKRKVCFWSGRTLTALGRAFRGIKTQSLDALKGSVKLRQMAITKF